MAPALKATLGVALGAAGGFVYYSFIGCDSGCAITSSPWVSTLWGAAIGFLAVPLGGPAPRQESGDASNPPGP